MVEDRLPAGLQGRRRAVVAGMLAGEAYEQPLAKRLREQLAGISGVTLYGPPEGSPRTSTVSFTLDGFQAGEVCRALGARGLFTWDGDFYAQRLVELLGLLGSRRPGARGARPVHHGGRARASRGRRRRPLAVGAMSAGPARPAGANAGRRPPRRPALPFGADEPGGAARGAPLPARLRQRRALVLRAAGGAGERRAGAPRPARPGHRRRHASRQPARSGRRDAGPGPRRGGRARRPRHSRPGRPPSSSPPPARTCSSSSR